MAADVDYLDILQSDHSAPRIVAVPRESVAVPVVYAAGLTAEHPARSTEAREGKMAKGKGKKGKKKSGKKLSKAARREIALKNLAKARKAKKAYTGARPHKKGSKKKGTTRFHKLTPKQRAAALANLEKARKALAKKGKKSGKAVRAPKMPKHAPVRAAAKRPKGKKKLTKAERAAISRRNLKKARAALKRGTHRPKAAKKGARKGGKLSKAKRREIAMKNLRKAHAARRSAKKAGRKHPVKPYSYSVRSKTVKVPPHKSWEGKGKRRSAKQKAASLRNIKKAQAARRRKGGGHKATEASRKGKTKRTAKQKAASLANLKKARAARKSASKRHDVKGFSYHRQGGKRHVYEYMMENPLTGRELAWGVPSSLVWFLVTDMSDRFWATHPLTAKGSTDASGHALYADVPVTAATWKTGYPGVYNPTAICAPMNLIRWGSGVVMIALPLGVARFVEHPLARSMLQAAGYGAILRIGGKAFIDLIAKLAMWTGTGQRLYDGEMRSMVLTSADQSPLNSLPAAGLGSVGCGSCTACETGVGACTQAGVGYPSVPREAAAPSSPTATTPATSNQPASPPPPPVPPASSSSTTTTTTTTTSPLAGLPAPRRSMYDWGHQEEEEREVA